MLRQAARRTVEAARVSAPVLTRLRSGTRRAVFVSRLRATALWASAVVELDVADDVIIGRGVRVTVEPGSRNLLRIGPGCRLDDDVLIQLKGGSIELVERVELRRSVVLNVAGRLRLEGDNPVSWNTVIHCSNEVTLAAKVGLAEQVTVADSSHYFTTPDEHFWHNVRTGSVTVGYNTWICPKATLARGAAVGSHCIVASNSVVVGPVPDGSLASGVPAEVRPLPLPWTRPSAG